MDEFSTITIDNKNLLDDLLGLSSGNDHIGSINNVNPLLLANQDDETVEYFFSKRNTNQNNTLLKNIQTGEANSNNFSQVPVNRFYLESPTFTKAEDDIYRFVFKNENSVITNIFENFFFFRYVHSRLSNPELATNRENNPNNHHPTKVNNPINDPLNDSIEGDMSSNRNNEKNILMDPSKRSGDNVTSFSSKPSVASNNQVPAPPPIQQRIGSNRLLSDLAVASLPPASNLIRRDPLIYSNHGNPALMGNLFIHFLTFLNLKLYKILAKKLCPDLSKF